MQKCSDIVQLHTSLQLTPVAVQHFAFKQQGFSADVNRYIFPDSIDSQRCTPGEDLAYFRNNKS